MVSEIGEKLRLQPCPYKKRKCENCPHSVKPEREGEYRALRGIR